jgi:pimeloyl-ACP methyl ester carboxylesterase
MDNRWLVLGGWSLPPAILHPIFSMAADYVDVNLIMPKLLDANTMLKSNWQSVLHDEIQNTTGGSFCGIAGWSTGAFCAYALRQYFPLCSTVLISSAPSFCTRENFKYGQNPHVVKVMRRQLHRDKTVVLESFWQQCGIPDNYPLIKAEYSIETLNAGLLFLEQVSLLPLNKTKTPLHIFHGTYDMVIPVDGAMVFEYNANANAHYYPGNHVFFLDQTPQNDIIECCKSCI